MRFPEAVPELPEGLGDDGEPIVRLDVASGQALGVQRDDVPDEAIEAALNP